ncbi:ATP-binding protein [Massilia sp. GCM10020059]|uniref:histidine kinase n=1 Tax=Massilia agrisoli TaxID=2892444 RepID=A0ABS8IWN7_9BURK|nr:response regulator [Massilia agrisoli]
MPAFRWSFPSFDPARLNSLRWRLLLLVGLAIAPMVAMTVAAGIQERQNALANARQNLQRLANLAAANEAQSLQGARQILRDLSSVSDVTADPAKCNELMADILSKNTIYVNFGLIEMDGNVSCSAVPLAAPVNLGDRRHFKRAVAERRFIASRYVFGRVIQKHTINLTYPVIKRGKVVAVLFAAIDLTELDRFVADVKLPPGTLMWTLDDQGTVISRRPDSAAWLGKKTTPTLHHVALTGRPPVIVRDFDGVERLYASAGVGQGDLGEYRVLIGVPEIDFLAAAERDQRFVILGLVTTVLLAGLAAWFGGNILIVQRMRRLAVTANLIASGSLATRTGMRYGNEEISELARSLDEMAAALQKKDAQRDHSEAMLVAADRRKDEFLAMLAHELRNPLAPISAGAEILKRTATDNPSISQAALIIARQAEHMTRLIDDLLDVSRVNRGFIELHTEALELGDIVNDAVEQVRPLITRKTQQLALDVSPAACPVQGDRKRLVQVVANLLTNAAKYTPVGGRIEVGVSCARDVVRLTVADNGIGMAPDLLARAFDLFAQGERASDRSDGGLGLGLALVKKLVGLHGGTVFAESEGLGHGSTLTVELPRIAVDAQRRDEVHAASIVPIAAGARCLLVDDNKDAAQMLSMYLDAHGFEVTVAYGGEQGLLAACEKPPAFCLLDIGLPDIDGNELVKRLRALPEAASAVMIAISGYGRAEDRERSLAAGFDHYFVKPVDVEALLALLTSKDQ